MMIQRSERTNIRNKFMENVGLCYPKNNWLARWTGMVFRPLWKVIEHAPLRIWKSYELWKQVMCMRARCQERSFHLEDLIRGKCARLLLLRHPIGIVQVRRYCTSCIYTSTVLSSCPRTVKKFIFDRKFCGTRKGHWKNLGLIDLDLKKSSRIGDPIGDERDHLKFFSE